MRVSTKLKTMRHYVTGRQNSIEMPEISSEGISRILSLNKDFFKTKGEKHKDVF